jgi:hypothetical protein
MHFVILFLTVLLLVFFAPGESYENRVFYT